MTEADLVTHLLANRHRIPSRTFINCLALARAKPNPKYRVTAEILMELFHHSSRSGISVLMSELRRCGLVEFQPGVRGEPGYLITRVGPRQEQADV
jgi:hypothetical protein